MRKTALVTVLIALVAWGGTATAGKPAHSRTRGVTDIQLSSKDAARFEVREPSSGAVQNVYVRRPQLSLGTNVVQRLGRRQSKPVIMNASVFERLSEREREAALGVTESEYTESMSFSADGILTLQLRGVTYKLVVELPDESSDTSDMHAQRVRKAMEKVPAVMSEEYGVPSRIAMRNDRYQMFVGGHWVPLEADGHTSPPPKRRAVRVATREAGRGRAASVIDR